MEKMAWHGTSQNLHEAKEWRTKEARRAFDAELRSRLLTLDQVLIYFILILIEKITTIIDINCRKGRCFRKVQVENFRGA